jgi:hypothetical protein
VFFYTHGGKEGAGEYEHQGHDFVVAKRELGSMTRWRWMAGCHVHSAEDIAG